MILNILPYYICIKKCIYSKHAIVFVGSMMHFNPCKLEKNRPKIFWGHLGPSTWTCRTRRRLSLLCASSMRKGHMEATTEAGEGNCRTSRGFPSASCQAMRLTFFQRQLWQTTKRPDGSPKEKHTPGYFHVKVDESYYMNRTGCPIWGIGGPTWPNHKPANMGFRWGISLGAPPVSQLDPIGLTYMCLSQSLGRLGHTYGGCSSCKNLPSGELT